ncbi:uncharacterized protein [Nicotiana tomentosiformis]|uniref:uncharacterized protein n=1 Tax=Nicotiana tomentosiformis TaxID=4098 RepID=UPI00388C4274
MDTQKVESVVNWPQPTTPKSLRGFLGLAGYYMRFIRGGGIGAVLAQYNRPIAFFSQGLSERNKALSVYKRELLALVTALQKWRPYLLGRQFTIKTDHHNFKYQLEQRITTPSQKKWLVKLLGYDYTISYERGKDNIAADALSTKDEHVQLFSISRMQSQLLNAVREWPYWLALAKWWYNTTFHSAINMTPYEAVYGQKPPPLLPHMAFDSQLDLVDRSLQARESTLRSLKFYLLRAQNIMKVQADKGRTDKSFSVGDWIIARVGYVAYTLNLPPDAKIHPTFHVSQLKKKLGSHTASVTLPVVHSEAGPTLLMLESIVDRRLVKKNGKPTTQVLIKWLNVAEEDWTWEDYETFCHQFPQFNP